MTIGMVMSVIVRHRNNLIWLIGGRLSGHFCILQKPRLGEIG